MKASGMKATYETIYSYETIWVMIHEHESMVVSIWKSLAEFRELLSQYSIVVDSGEVEKLQQYLPESNIIVVDYDEAPNKNIEWFWNGYNFWMIGAMHNI